MEAAQSEQSSVDSTSRAKASIYVIDDEKPVASLIEALLLEEGYEVYVSYSGEDALAQLKAGSLTVDLFLVDVVLPDISGPDLAQELLELAPDAAVLFTSGYGEGAGAALRRSNPDATFLSKPFNPADLTQAVETALA